MERILVYSGAMMLAAGLVVLAISNPGIMVIVGCATVSAVILSKVGDWWRRCLVVVVIAMYMGASNIEFLAGAGTYLKSFALIVLVLITHVSSYGQRSEHRNSLHKLALITLWTTAAFALASVAWSASRAETALQSVTLVGFVYLLHRVSTVRWKNNEIIVADLKVIYWSSFVALAIGAGLAFAGVDGAISPVSGRHLGLLSNPNLLGLLAGLTFGLGVFVSVHEKSKFAWFSLIVPLSQILSSQSRTALIALLIAGIWVIVRRGTIRTFLISTPVLGVILIGLVFIRPGQDVVDEGLLARFTTPQGDGLLNSRTHAWTDVFTFLQENLLGSGWATTQTVFAELNQAGYGSGVGTVHNSYLQILFELGWIGAVPLALVVILFGALLLSPRSTGADPALLLVITMGVSMQITESALFGLGQPYPYLFWFSVLAAILLTQGQPKKNNKQDTVAGLATPYARGPYEKNVQ